MKKMIILCLVVLMLGLTVSLNAETFSATASIASDLSMLVTLGNVTAPTVLDFGSFGVTDVPHLATNATNYSYANVAYSTNEPAWKIKVYTDNSAVGAVPRFTGTLGENGEMDDGSGLILVEADNTSDKSTLMKWWSNARFADALAGDPYFAAPCTLWDGSAFDQGVPKPDGDGVNRLYWAPKGEDLNNNGYDGNGFAFDVITSNWFEDDANGGPTHRDYDANGDGDYGDQIGAGAGQDLGTVFENAIWRAVVDTSSTADGSKVVGCHGIPQSGSFNVYFGITDDQVGTYKTNQLIFEISLN